MQFTLRVLVLLIWIGHITISPEQCDASTRLMFASKTDQNFSFKGNLLNQSCRWKIQSVSSDYTVQVLCLVMSLMENRNCRDSSVTMYDGANESAPVIERLCNCSKGTYTSSGTFMFLRYDSNQMATSTQFEFLYRAVKKTESEAGPSSDDSALRALVIIGACFLAVVLLIIVSYSIKKVNDNRNGEIGASTNASDHADQANGNLPPNYSDLSMRNGRLGLEPDAFTAQYSGENSVLATPPPVYAEFMLEIFPPKTPPTPKTRPLRSTEMREVELTGINPGIAHLTESAGLGPRSTREADIVEAETMNRNSLQSRERVVAKPTNRNRGPSRSTETAVSELENTEDNGTISTRL